jgi:hypothetical protein
VLHHGGLPAPLKYHLVRQVPASALPGCLLQFESIQDGEACVNCIRQWQDSIPRMEAVCC